VVCVVGLIVRSLAVAGAAKVYTLAAGIIDNLQNELCSNRDSRANSVDKKAISVETLMAS